MALLCCWPILPAAGATFHVGPNQSLAEIGQVPWESLAAGDTVWIHWRSNAYKAKWVIGRQGTEQAPIVIKGVPGTNGELPVIDGNGATTWPVLSYWNQPRGVIKIGGANNPPDTTPRYITLENLEVRSGRPPYTFNAANGGSTAYPNNAAAIYVEKGEHITIRNCTMRDSGNGLFVAFEAKDVLIEGNYLYDNGNVDSLYEHNSYTAAIGITFQFNRYGPLRVGCLGNNLKDRSAGLVVRYNWIEGGNRQLDLVDAEDSPLIQTNALYHQTFVCGNILVEPDGAGNRQIVHYGGDSGNTSIYRKGTLYFHNNTVVSTRADRTTLFRLSSNDEYCDCRNNIFYVSAAGNTVSLLDDTGRLYLTHNWLKPGYVQSFGTSSGTVTNDGLNFSGTAPGFLDIASQNLHLATNSTCTDVGTNLDSAVPAAHYPVRHYIKHQKSESRRSDARLDLGAYEYSPYHAWRQSQFGVDYETAVAATDTADPDGDGIPNLLEYAYQLNPNTPSANGLPMLLITSSNGNAYGSIRFNRRLPPSEVTYVVQVTTNLVAWNDASTWSDAVATPDTPSTTCLLAGTSTVVRFNSTLKTSPRAFLRVRVRHEY